MWASTDFIETSKYSEISILVKPSCLLNKNLKMDKKILNTMFENLLHIGNKTNYWSPKMKPYIYGAVNGIHVFNLVETATKMEEVKTELAKLASEGNKILFVATKLQARDSFASLAEDTGHYYVSEKWVPGLLTNFKTIKRRISTYISLSKDSTTGAFDILTKKEKANKLLELEKLDRAFKGVREMKTVPKVIFIVDGVFEKQALKEANSLGLNVFSISNTNGDDSAVTDLIPANTNSVKSLDYLAAEFRSVLKDIKVKKVPRQMDGKRITSGYKAPVKKAPAKADAPAAEKPAAKKEEK